MLLKILILTARWLYKKDSTNIKLFVLFFPPLGGSKIFVILKRLGATGVFLKNRFYAS